IRLARNLKRHHNYGVKTVSRPSRLGGWSVRCASVALAFAFCASAFAADPSKNGVVSTTQQPATTTTKKLCYTVTGTSRIPQPCDRLAAIPTTANHMTIYGHHTGRESKPPTIPQMMTRCRRSSAEVGLYFCAPSHQSAQLRANFFDWVLFSLPQQVQVTTLFSSHF